MYREIKREIFRRRQTLIREFLSHRRGAEQEII